MLLLILLYENRKYFQFIGILRLWFNILLH